MFTAITFAIARILGVFRTGGGDVQEAAGAEVQTRKVPATAKVMPAFTMMGPMVMTAGIVTNFLAAGTFSDTDPADIVDSAQYAAAGSGLRRRGAGTAFDLGTIIEVLRYQTRRLGEVTSAHQHRH